MNIAAHFAEMSFDGLPSTARGNAHFFVVVAIASAGGEGIAKPEVPLQCNIVGDIREACSSLVGGDNQIRIVAIVTQDIFRRNNRAVRIHIVGQVE